MARLPRKFLKVFAKDASNNGVFGSAADNTKILSNDVEVIQSKAAWLTGWIDAVIGTRKFPTLEEFQSCNYVNTSQISYIFQEGIPEWNPDTEYFQKSIVKKTGTYEIYGSLTDDNVGNLLSDTDNWQFLQDLSLEQKIPYGVTTGAGGTYTVSTAPSFDSLVDGSPFIIKANHTNAGSATLNPNSIGNIPLYANGAVLTGGEIISGSFYLMIPDNTNNRIYVANPSLVQATVTRIGALEIATPAEMIAQTDQLRAATPYNVNQLFSATGRQNLAESGFQILPAGLIFQWGIVTVPPESSGGSGEVDVNFPMEFPTSLLSITTSTQISDAPAASDSHNFVQIRGNPTKSGFRARNQWVGLTNSEIIVRWMAVGI